MDFDDGLDDESSVFRPPPLPDDRVWIHPSELPPARPRAPRRPPRLWSVALVSGLVGALFSAGLVAAAGGFGDDGGGKVVERVVERPTIAPVQRDTSTSVSEIADRVLPAITQVQVDGRGGSGSGSGVIFRSDGHLLTNNHVVEGARDIEVVLSNGDVVDGKLVGTDPDTDIAVVKIEGDGPFPTAALGTAANLKVGDSAIAIGSPLGLAGGPSVTVGVVSALGRRVDSRSGPPLLDMIQTDAPIAPGSSGGALLDGNGSVIGITTAIAVSDVGAEGLGFATPIDVARWVADQLMTSGKVVHVWLGIEGRDVDRDTADRLDIDGGAMVQNVIEDSPAQQAGLEQRDVIVAVDDDDIDSMSALIVALRDHRPGSKVRLTVVRDGERRQVDVTLAERPEDL
jgi:S1-C subfamily serine protease